MRLLVAVDKSNASIEAVRSALDMAENVQPNVTLELVHCVDPRLRMNGGAYESNEEQALQQGRDVLDEVEELARSEGVETIDVNTHLIHANGLTVVEELEDHINKGDYDLVFVGHRNRPEKTERHIGSTTKKLIGKSSIPVVSV